MNIIDAFGWTCGVLMFGCAVAVAIGLLEKIIRPLFIEGWRRKGFRAIY